MRPDRHAAEPRGLWSAVSSAVVLAAASDWMAGVRARKADRDPAGLENSADALVALAADHDRARTLVHRIRVLGGEGAREDPADALREVGALIHVARLGPVMHRVHQRLMSLYPLADEGLLEQARMAEGWLAECAGGDLSSQELANRIGVVLDRLPTAPNGS